MTEQPITFSSGELSLEGLLAQPGVTAKRRAIVVCHPHPLYGGSMYNNVVEAVLETAWRLGWATMRFNFRGVGQSEGEHGGGEGEAGDAAAATSWLAARLSLNPEDIVLAGYSFGAMAAARSAATIESLGALALVALPIRMGSAGLGDYHGRIILAAGDRDAYCPAAQLQALLDKLGARAQLRIIAGADHFFVGHEAQLANALESMLGNLTAQVS